MASVFKYKVVLQLVILFIGNLVFASSQTITGDLLLGRPCTENSQCVASHSMCTGVCDCIAGFTPNLKLDDCLLIQDSISGSCKETQQCQRGQPGQHSTCLNNQCKCLPNYIHPAGENRCYKAATMIGEGCDHNAQCFVNLVHALCLSGNCSCIGDSIESTNKTKCLLKMNLGEECEEQAQCTHINHSACQMVPQSPHSKCQCNSTEGYTTNPNNAAKECIKLAASLNESCEIHQVQCGMLPGSHCNTTTNTCQCNPENQVESQDKKRCYEKTHFLNGTCFESAQCQVSNSECRGMTPNATSLSCLCKSDFVEGETARNTCLLEMKNIGDTCAENVQCHSVAIDGNVECRDGYCNCPESTPPSNFYNGKCTVPSKLNRTCEDHNECHLGVNMFSACVLKNNSRPPVKWCVCQPSTVTLYESCWQMKRLNDACTNHLQCTVSITGPVECSNRKCACASGYRPHSTEYHCVSGGNVVKVWFGSLHLLALLSLFLFVKFT